MARNKQNKQVQNKLKVLEEKENQLDSAIKEVGKIAMESRWETADPLIRHQQDSPFGRPLYYSSANLYDRQLGHYPPFYTTETDLQEIRETARFLEAININLVAALNHLTNYVIGTGFTYTAVPKDGASPRLAELAQQIMDEFWHDNHWPEWEQELFQRSKRDGEYFLHFQDQGMGYLRVKTLEPEQITEPKDKTARNNDLGLRMNDVSWTYGVCADRNDSTNVHGYWTVSQLDHNYQRGEYIDIQSLQHMKINAERTAKRGVSDFFQLFGDLEETRKLLRNLRRGAGIQAAIAYIRQHGPGVTQSQATDMQSALTSRTFNIIRPGEDGSTNGTIKVQEHNSPVILDTKFGTDYKAGPLGGNSSPLIDVLGAAYRAIGKRWGLPEGMISGDWSNNAFASALMSEAPFVKEVLKTQAKYKYWFGKVMKKVLQHAAEAGRFRYYGVGACGIMAALDIQVDAQNIATRNRQEDFAIDSGLLAAKVMSKKTFASRYDLDLDQEEEQIAQEESVPTQLPEETPLEAQDPAAAEVQAQRVAAQGQNPY
jgi:hypothetical protein